MSHSILMTSLSSLGARLLVLVCGVGLAVGAPEALAEVPREAAAASPARGDLRSAVQAQLAALQRGDALSAWAAASPRLKARFGTPEAYLERMQADYGALLRSHRRALGPQADLPSGEVGQWIDVVGLDGEVVRVLVLLEPIDGRWQTTGWMLFSPGHGAA